MQKSQLWIIAGGNGAGKSTFYRLFLEHQGSRFINADLLAYIMSPHATVTMSYSAARYADEIRVMFLRKSKSFCFETVFSHPSKVDLIKEAKTLGYEVCLVIIHLENEELNLARVAQRVSEGGHDVPADKVVSRIPRTLTNLRKALPFCDRVLTYNNSRLDQPFRSVFAVKHGAVEEFQNPLPRWADELMGELP